MADVKCSFCPEDSDGGTCGCGTPMCQRCYYIWNALWALPPENENDQKIAEHKRCLLRKGEPSWMKEEWKDLS